MLVSARGEGIESVFRISTYTNSPPTRGMPRRRVRERSDLCRERPPLLSKVKEAEVRLRLWPIHFLKLEMASRNPLSAHWLGKSTFAAKRALSTNRSCSAHPSWYVNSVGLIEVDDVSHEPSCNIERRPVDCLVLVIGCFSAGLVESGHL